MNQVSPLGWVAIGFILLVGAAVNLWMIALLRNRDPEALNRLLRPKNDPQAHQNMQKFIEVLRDPYRAEKQDLKELARRVESLKKQPPAS